MGPTDGAIVGDTDGFIEGESEGATVGNLVGEREGVEVGPDVGCCVLGEKDGVAVRLNSSASFCAKYLNQNDLSSRVTCGRLLLFSCW